MTIANNNYSETRLSENFGSDSKSYIEGFSGSVPARYTA